MNVLESVFMIKCFGNYCVLSDFCDDFIDVLWVLRSFSINLFNI